MQNEPRFSVSEEKVPRTRLSRRMAEPGSFETISFLDLMEGRPQGWAGMNRREEQEVPRWTEGTRRVAGAVARSRHSC